MSTRPLRVRVAFEIIVQHFSCKPQPIENTQTEIYKLVREKHSVNAYVGPAPEKDDVKKTLTYLNHFGLIEKCRPQPCWHIKSVDEMCARLCEAHNRNRRNDDQPLTVSIAFEIIIQHFSGDTTVLQRTTDIETRVFNVHGDQGGLPKYDVKDPVRWTLRFLNYFDFAEKESIGSGEDMWRIKSVDEMCARLRALVHNRNIEDEGVEF